MDKSVLDRNISVFKSYAGTQPETKNLLSYLSDTSHVEEVLKIRATSDVDKQKALKAKLPAATISGLFSARGESNLISHSGLMCIDIDRKDNIHLKEFYAVKRILMKLPFVAYCALSVSGNGYWAIVPISNPSKHKAHFAALKNMFAEVAINIDAAPSNVASLRGYSWDPDAYYNHKATTYSRVFEAPVRQMKPSIIMCGNNFEFTPFAEYNLNGDINSLMLNNGWTIEEESEKKVLYTRPGKQSGISADYCKNRKALYVFTNASVFIPNKAYDHTAIFCVLECNGDYREARRRLLAMGYGKTT